MVRREAIEELLQKYPELAVCEQDIVTAVNVLKNCFRSGGKLLVCGNGGSAADSEHIVGELMKGFMSKRQIQDVDRAKFIHHFSADGIYLANHLQGALPAISLTSSIALTSAYANDVAADMIYAQQVYGYGKPGDVLLGITTSGNSVNVIRAVQTAKVQGLYTVGLSGKTGGKMLELCDTTICVPHERTPDIQERHLPIYHAICIMLEQDFFS